jgi:hypothetical protein
MPHNSCDAIPAYSDGPHAGAFHRREHRNPFYGESADAEAPALLTAGAHGHHFHTRHRSHALQ